MGTHDLLATLQAIEALLLARTGVSCASQRPNDSDLADLPQTSVMSDELAQGLARALAVMQRKHQVTILYRYQLPQVDKLNPETVVKTLVRFAAAAHAPEVPRKEEWKTDNELRGSIVLAYHEFVRGVLGARRNKVLATAVQLYGPVDAVRDFGMRMVYAIHMTRPPVVRLVHEAMASLPEARQGVFLELLLTELGSMDPTQPCDMEMYKLVLAHCLALVSPVATIKGASNLN